MLLTSSTGSDTRCAICQRHLRSAVTYFLDLRLTLPCTQIARAKTHMMCSSKPQTLRMFLSHAHCELCACRWTRLHASLPCIWNFPLLAASCHLLGLILRLMA